MEWQPIETAPKNGLRLILAAHVSGNTRVFIGGFDPYWHGKCWVSEDARVPIGFEPTHWMPLPERPVTP